MLLTLRKERLLKLIKKNRPATCGPGQSRTVSDETTPAKHRNSCETVAFSGAGGTLLRGILLRPAGATSRVPVLVMAHGFSCTWRQGLLPIARACQARGVAVLLFDHASFGDSDGEPRCVVDWWGQLLGYQRALDFVCAEPSIDSARIGLFGFSLSGAETLLLSALDARVKALVAVAPGPIDVPASPDPSLFAALQREFAKRAAQAAGVSESAGRAARDVGAALPVVPPHGPWQRGKSARSWFGERIPGKRDAVAFFGRRGGPRAGWVNSSAQVLDGIPDWDEAIAHVHVPTLLIAAADDVTKPLRTTRELLDALPATSKRLHVLERGGHFGMFDTPLREPGSDGAKREAPAPFPAMVDEAANAVACFVAVALNAREEVGRDDGAAMCETVTPISVHRVHVAA